MRLATSRSTLAGLLHGVGHGLHRAVPVLRQGLHRALHGLLQALQPPLEVLERAVHRESTQIRLAQAKIAGPAQAT